MEREKGRVGCELASRTQTFIRTQLKQHPQTRAICFLDGVVVCKLSVTDNPHPIFSRFHLKRRGGGGVPAYDTCSLIATNVGVRVFRIFHALCILRVSCVPCVICSHETGLHDRITSFGSSFQFSLRLLPPFPTSTFTSNSLSLSLCYCLSFLALLYLTYVHPKLAPTPPFQVEHSHGTARDGVSGL